MPTPTHRCKLTALAAALGALFSLPAAATNGMNLEAYGAKAGGMLIRPVQYCAGARAGPSRDGALPQTLGGPPSFSSR